MSLFLFLADRLTRGARSSPTSMFYVDSTPPVWLSEPAGVVTQFSSCCKKRHMILDI